MFNNNGGYSLADIAAATGNDRNNGYGNGMWGDGAWWIIILFLFCFNGNGNWGNGGNNAGMQGALTRADLCSEFNFNGLENSVRNVSDAVNVGFANMNSTICHQQYDTAALINGVNNNLSSAICNLGYQNAQLINGVTMNQIQNQNATLGAIKDCCCENRQGQADIKYQMATDTCAIQNSLQNLTRDIIDSQNNGFRAVLDKMCQQEMAAKDAQIAAQNQKIFGLELAASQANQNNYLINQLRPCPQPAYLTCNPFTGQTYSYGSYGNGCGCNNNCSNSCL